MVSCTIFVLLRHVFSIAFRQSLVEVSEKIGIHKRKNKLEVEDNNVETTKIDNLIKKSPSKILDRGFLEQVWGHIFAKSKEIQRKIQVDQNEEK